MAIPYGDDHSFLRGMVEGLTYRPSETAQLSRIDVAVAPGSLGGGLFDDKGGLVGIVTAGLTDAQNLNIVLSSEWILAIPTRNLGRVAAGVHITEANVEPGAKPQGAASVDNALTDIRPGAQCKYRMSTQARSAGTVTFGMSAVSGDRIRERIFVPAGAFDTTLFEATAEPVFWQSSPHVVKCRYWYAENVSRPVKMEIEIVAGYTIGNTMETYELVSFGLGK